MGHARDITGIPRLLARPSRATRARLVAVALLAFALRALIPLGFMPASDGSLSLMICPGGLPAGILHGEGMDQGNDQGIGQGIGQGKGQGIDQGIDQGMGPSMHPGLGETMGQGRATNRMPMPAGVQTPAQQHQGGHGLMDEGYCTFTTGFSSAPPPLLLAALFLLLSCATIIVLTVLAPAGIRLVHLPQARAPPASL